MRMTASWSGSNDPAVYKFVAGRYAPMASSPRILCRPAPTGARSYAKSPIAVHRRCACSGVKALRNTSPAKRQAAKPLLAFRSLDPFRALRKPDRRRRDEEPLSRSEQRTDNNPKNDLTGKAPYKSECLPRAIQRRCRIRDSASSFAANDWLSVILREHLIEGCNEPRTWSDRTRCARRAGKIRPDECDRTRPGALRALGNVKARANRGAARQRAAGHPPSGGARGDCQILPRKRP